MFRLTMGVLAASALLAVPQGAAADTDCGYAGGGPAQVYTSGGQTGDALVGACVDTGLPVDGGYVEAGTGTEGSYAVIDGSDSNPANAAGYAGLSTYEQGGSADPTCDGVDNDPTSGTNSGGCLWLKPLGTGAEVPLIVCGNTSGTDWSSTTRDGCSIP